MFRPAARRKVLAMPPPTIVDPPLGQALQNGRVWWTLRARHNRKQRALGVLQGARYGIHFRGRRGAAAGHRRVLGNAVGAGFGAVGRTKCVVHKNATQGRHLASVSDRLFLTGVAAAVFQHDQRAWRNRNACDPVANQGHLAVRGSPKRLAAGASGSAADTVPSVGRPRCEVAITAAPASRAMAMQAMLARMRVSSVMLPASSCGTLRSERMNTRLPATWPCARKSEKRITFMASPVMNGV